MLLSKIGNRYVRFLVGIIMVIMIMAISTGTCYGVGRLAIQLDPYFFGYCSANFGFMDYLMHGMYLMLMLIVATILFGLFFLLIKEMVKAIAG